MTSDRELLIGLLEGSLGAEDRARIEAALRTDANLRAEYEALRRDDVLMRSEADAAWQAESNSIRPLDVSAIIRAARMGSGDSADDVAVAPAFLKPPASGATIVPMPERNAEPPSRLRRWVGNGYGLVAAAAMLLAVAGITMHYFQGDGQRTGGGPRDAGIVIESQSRAWPLQSQVPTHVEHDFDGDSPVTIRTLDESGDVLIFAGGARVQFSSATRVTQQGGRALYTIENPSDMFKVTLPGDVTLATQAGTFEVEGTVVRVKDRDVRVSLRGMAAPIHLGAGEELDTAASDPKPTKLAPEQRQAIGQWTGQYGRATIPETPAATPTGTPASTTTPGPQSRELPDADSLLARVPASALAVALIPPDHVLSRDNDPTTVDINAEGPWVFAILPNTPVPLVMVPSTDPLATADRIHRRFGQSTSSRMKPQISTGADFEYELLEAAPSAWSGPTVPTGIVAAEVALTRANLAILAPAEESDPHRWIGLFATPGSRELSPVASRLMGAPASPTTTIHFSADVGRLWLQATPEQLIDGGEQVSAMLVGSVSGELDERRLDARLELPASASSFVRLMRRGGSADLMGSLPLDAGLAISFAGDSMPSLVQWFDAGIAASVYANDAESHAAHREGLLKELRAAVSAEVLESLDGRMALSLSPGAMRRDGLQEAVPVISFGLGEADAARRALEALHPDRAIDFVFAADGSPQLVPASGGAPPPGSKRHRLVWDVADGAVRLSLKSNGLNSPRRMNEHPVLRRVATENPEASALLAFDTERVGPVVAKLLGGSRRSPHATFNRAELVALAVTTLTVEPPVLAINGHLPGTDLAHPALLEALRLPALADQEQVRMVTMMNRKLDDVATAIHRFCRENGRAPTNLDELLDADLLRYPLTDPFAPAGTPLMYRATSELWSVWSLGPDGIDNGGIPSRSSRTLLDTGDLVRTGTVPSPGAGR